MTNAFDDREKAFEAHFRLDQETAFKVNVRKDKLLGLWVAERLGLSGQAAQDYARQVVESDFEEPGDADVVRKVMRDLAARDVAISEETLRKEMTRLEAVARTQIVDEIKTKPLED
ncbi:MAG: DUF1476 domain-containing protein [Alphaproteobacteria bacterium]|nr:DUF1476 domain-containing protein [Alphaproteobacteria bacterium]